MEKTINRNKKTLAADFTDGPILKQMFFFTAPLFLSNLLQIFYNMADMAVVGHVDGKTGLAAVSIGGDITNCLTVVMMGFATAAQVIIAQYLGGGKKERIGEFIGTMSVFFFIGASGISILCLTFRRQILRWMSTPKPVWEEADRYITVSLAGLLFLCGYNLASAVFRGLGDSKHPFLFISISSVFNIFLDIIFVAYFHWGAAGAAAGTVIAQALSFMMALGLLYRRKETLGFAVQKSDFKIRRRMLALLVRQGIPLAMKSAAVQFTRLFTNSFINSYGDVVCAASGVTGKVNSISNLLSESLNTAGASMVSQNIGSEKYGRVKRILFWMLMITIPIAVILSFCMIRRPDVIFRFFTEEEEVIKICLGYVPISIMAFFSSAVR